MQDEINQRTADLSKKAVVLVIKGGSKLTAAALKTAMRAFLNATGHGEHGKMSVRQLIRKDQGVQNIEITDSNIRPFVKIARKYGVDFAVKKDPSEDKYLVFFKARDSDALTAAFSEYTAKTVGREERPSLAKRLDHFKEIVKKLAKNVEKHRQMGAR